MTNPPGMYPPPQQPVYAQQLIPGWEQRTQRGNGGGGGAGGGGGSFGDAFDFSFERYATPAVVKVLYAVTVVFCVVTYVGTVLMAFAFFAPDRNVGGIVTIPGTPVPGIITVIVGWIPAFMSILGMRLACEQALATVRTTIDARGLRTRYVGPVNG